MITRTLQILVFALTGLLIVACSGDDDPMDPGQGIQYEDLTQQDHVLTNLELAYNQRNLARIEELLASDFEFIFSVTDHGLGYTPDRWNRAEEMLATDNLFNPGYIGGDPVLAIQITIEHTAGGWEEATTSVGAKAAPGTLFKKTFTYDLAIDIDSSPAGYTLIGTDLHAELTIRQVASGDKQIWTIVGWRDDVDAGQLRRSAAGPPPEETTWGMAKAFYQG